MTPTAAHHTAHIVVGWDRAGPNDDAVLTAGLAQARRADADLRIVHAITGDVALPDVLADSADRRRDLGTRHRRIRNATTKLRREAEQLGATGTVHYDVQYGDPATIILAAAQQADLIVVGTHGSGAGRSPLLLGTVSQDIAVHATCPVLLIPTAPAP